MFWIVLNSMFLHIDRYKPVPVNQVRKAMQRAIRARQRPNVFKNGLCAAWGGIFDP